MPTQEQYRFTVDDALASLPTPEGKRFTSVFRHGTMLIELYGPRGVDPQEPHTRDELYVVISGTGTFLNGTARTAFGPGDILFVPAGREHRFVDFTDDFATWVMFYGPEGGEPA